MYVHDKKNTGRCVRKKVCVCEREKMGVDVWTGGREVAGKVSLCHLFLPTRAEKPDTAPKTQLVQRPAFLNRVWSSKA